MNEDLKQKILDRINWLNDPADGGTPPCATLRILELQNVIVWLAEAEGRRQETLRKLIENLHKNEKAYTESKEDYEITDTTRFFINGRIRESEIIRIELEKVLGEASSETKP
jgi:hypothetical protein